MMGVEMKGIYKSFNAPQGMVLDNVDLSLPIGITCLMGASGIGKTTLANILAGLVKPDSGEVTGREGKRLSMVFQEDRLLDWASALTNVLFVVPSAKKTLDRAMELLTQAGLGDSLHKKAAELSGGMRRRVALCRALVGDFDLLILDEPFKGLDEGIKPGIFKMVREHGAGKVVLCITHDAGEVAGLGGRKVMLH